MWSAQLVEPGDLFSGACAGVCFAAGSSACFGSTEPDGSLEVFLKCRHLNSNVCFSEVNPGWLAWFKCLNLHAYSWLRVCCHLLAANPSLSGFSTRVVPYLPAPCGCLGYTLPATSALPPSSGEVVPDKNNPVSRFPSCISWPCLVQPALTPAKPARRSVSTSCASSCGFLAFPSPVKWWSSPFPGGADANGLGEVEGLRKAWTDEWLQCAALLHLSNFAQFADGLGVKSGIGALFHMNSALTSGQPVKCDFTWGTGWVRVVFFFFPRCWNVFCTLLSNIVGFLAELARHFGTQSVTAPNQAGPAEYYKQ